VSKVLPELSDLQIIGAGDAEPGSNQFKFTKTTTQITLRQLLTHSSGLAYDFLDPVLLEWRSSRNESPKALNGTIVDAMSVPLRFEPGEGWAYSSGIDWAGLLVSRLNNNIPLEEYMQENICKPLGLESTTFRLEKHPAIKAKLVSTSARQPDGTMISSQRLWPEYAHEDCAGAGIYSTVEDFTKIVGDLVRDSPVLLKTETVEKMFVGQLPRGSIALESLRAAAPALEPLTGVSNMAKAANHALGAIYLDEQTATQKQGTLCGAGLPHCFWFANRNEGLAAFYASQVLPPGDPAATKLAFDFFQEICRPESV
jgi:CubicO group peptidase (beta-lactamase class C family)